jgi:transcriptional regulator with XRE-family HTH domain
MLHTWPNPERLRERRRRALLTQRDVERATGISDSTVAYLECGRRKPQTGTLRKLLSLYDRNIQALEQRERRWWETGEPQSKAPPVAQAGAPSGRA